jgi:hypothetical protein
VLVKGWQGGGGTFGIRIGAPNRRLYFNPAWKSVLIEIDGLRHDIAITDGFWKKCPELRSRAIKEWMTANGLIPWPKQDPPSFELTALADRVFRLEQ